MKKDGICGQIFKPKLFKKNQHCITAMQVYIVDTETVGADISDQIDIFCHLYLTKLITEELNLL